MCRWTRHFVACDQALFTREYEGVQADCRVNKTKYRGEGNLLSISSSPLWNSDALKSLYTTGTVLSCRKRTTVNYQYGVERFYLTFTKMVFFFSAFSEKAVP